MHHFELIDFELIHRSLFPHRPAPKPPRAALNLALETGLVEPIVVKRAGNRAFPRYELLSGEVSLEIANRAVLSRVPAVVIDSISDAEARAFVLAHLTGDNNETLGKRSPGELFQILSAIEQTKSLRLQRNEKCSYKALAGEYGLSADLLSHLRRLKARLHPTCINDLVDRRITLGHAKALATFPKFEQPRIATRIIRRGYSVRRVETSARNRRRGKEDDLNRGTVDKTPDVLRAQREISHRFGWRTEIAFDPETKDGSITFHFDTLDSYEYLLERLGIDPRIDGE